VIRKIGDTSGPRLIVIGLDGASFNYLDPILESGRVPSIARLLSDGVRSDCISTVPPLTPPAWSTMLTGVNPGKHGIFDFLQPDETGAFRVVDAGIRRRKTFLRHAFENQIRTINLLVPYTFPSDPDTVGLAVSGLGTPSWESDFIRPHGKRDELLGSFPFLKTVDPTKGESIDTLHEKLHSLTQHAADLARYALEDLPDWGIMFTVFQATDLIPHFYSRYFDPQHPDYDADEIVSPGFRNALLKIYLAIDIFVGECLEIIEKDGGWIILVSDHGSQPLMGAIGKDAFLSRWLEDNGYLVTRGQAGRAKQAVKAQAGSLANRLLFLAKRYTPHGIRDAVNRLLGSRKDQIVGRVTGIPFLEDIDWENTRAFCAPGGYGVGLYINREGDFPHGIVSLGADYHKLRDEIKAGLESIEISEGVKLFNSVLTREDALWGPVTSLAPDLLLLWREDSLIRENNYKLTDGRKLDPPETKPGSGLTWCGTHRMEGLFGIYGEGVSSGVRLKNVPNLSDVMPTIQYLSGMKIPSDVDGKIIDEAFTDAFLNENKPGFGPPDSGSTHTKVASSPDESEKMLDLLQGLGYLN